MNAFFRCSLFLSVLTLVFVSCRQPDDENLLDHPTFSLIVEHDFLKNFHQPSWSPDGNYLSMNGVENCFDPGVCRSQPYIFEILSGEIRLFKEGWSQKNIVWTSDPDIVSFHGEDPSGIYVTDINTTSTPEFVIEGEMPVWAPNGSYLAFSRFNDGRYTNNGISSGLFILELETKNETEIFIDKLGKKIIGMSWSADSKWLATAAVWKTPNDNYDSGIFIFGNDGEEVQRLIKRGEIIGYGIGWMPDGEWLFYLKGGRLNFTPKEFECFIEPLDVQLEGFLSYPVISPDGDNIAVEHRWDIYLLDLDELLGANREALVCP